MITKEEQQRCLLMMASLSSRYPKLLKVEEEWLQELYNITLICETEFQLEWENFQRYILNCLQNNQDLQKKEQKRDMKMSLLDGQVFLLNKDIKEVYDRFYEMQKRCTFWMSILVEDGGLEYIMNKWYVDIKRLDVPLLSPYLPKPRPPKPVLRRVERAAACALCELREKAEAKKQEAENANPPEKSEVPEIKDIKEKSESPVKKEAEETVPPENKEIQEAIQEVPKIPTSPHPFILPSSSVIVSKSKP